MLYSASEKNDGRFVFLIRQDFPQNYPCYVEIFFSREFYSNIRGFYNGAAQTLLSARPSPSHKAQL